MKLAIIEDYREENWPSMNNVADELVVHTFDMPGVEVTRICPRMLAPFQRFANGSQASLRLHNLDRTMGRYLEYPLRLLADRRRFDRYHIVDHSYGQLALALPGAKTGIFCHDVDAFRPLFQKGAEAWRRALSRTLLAGLRRASVVFHSTTPVRDEILAYGFVPRDRLVAAPYGIARAFHPDPEPNEQRRTKAPYLLHVGSLIPRKNPEFLLQVFAAVARLRPDLEFLQVGGEYAPALEKLIDELALRTKLLRLSGISQFELASLYRHASAVLLPSVAEGFGLPVIEALSCGARVVVSDIPVLRQVGGEAVTYCAPSDLGAWQAAILDVLAQASETSRALRLRHAATYSWQAHAEIIVEAHRRALALEKR